jgi:hypothetical protein
MPASSVRTPPRVSESTAAGQAGRNLRQARAFTRLHPVLAGQGGADATLAAVHWR